jgi:hypothetical protein
MKKENIIIAHNLSNGNKWTEKISIPFLVDEIKVQSFYVFNESSSLFAPPFLLNCALLFDSPIEIFCLQKMCLNVSYVNKQPKKYDGIFDFSITNADKRNPIEKHTDDIVCILQFIQYDKD